MKNTKHLLLFFLVTFVFSGCDSQRAETPNDNSLSSEYQSVKWINEHPWREDYNIEVMPVFRNPFHMIPAEFAQNEGLSANSLSYEEMAKIAENIIIAMGLEVENVDIADRFDIIWAQGITATTENVKVTVEAHGFVQVTFENGMPLPDGLIFSWEYPCEEAIVYLTERFAPILGIEQADFENNSNNIVEQILDYHFNNIHFIPNSDDKLWQINRFPSRNDVLADKIGYFPIVTTIEAVERMVDGQGSFGVNMGQTRPTADEIIDIRLVYFGHNLGRNFLEEFAPWYELIVLTSDTHHVQSYFVPAIKSEYLEDNPAWSVYPHQ